MRFSLILSGVGFVLLLNSCAVFQTRVEEVEGTETKVSFCHNNFFQRSWGKRKVPLCPSSEGLVLLPATYPAAQIFLGYASQPVHVQFLRELIEKLAEDPERPQVVILVPRQENEEAYRLYQKYLEAPYSQFVRFIPMPSEDSLWTQDYFEVGISTVSGKGTIIELPSQGLERKSIPAALALSCQMNLVRQNEPNDLKTSGGPSDFGGNIEAFPGNFVLVGDNMSSAAEELLDVNLSQDIVKVNTSWGEPGNISEVYGVLPNFKSTDKNCDFAVIYSSPRLALQILREKGLKSKRERISPPIPEGEESIPVVERTDFEACFDLVPGDAYLKANPKLRKRCEHLLKANETYAKIIDQGLEQLVDSISQRTSCSEVQTIPMPVVYGPERERPSYGGKEDHAVNINPNPINLFTLGKTVVLARQEYQPFEGDILEKLNSLGLEPYPIDGSYVHYLRGGIHCTSNVVRMCSPLSADVDAEVDPNSNTETSTNIDMDEGLDSASKVQSM